MFSEKDMEKMFLAGMEWERRSIQPVSLKEAIASALAQIEAAQHRAHPTGGGLCAVCGKSADHHEDHDYVAPLTATSG